MVPSCPTNDFITFGLFPFPFVRYEAYVAVSKILSICHTGLKINQLLSSYY